jgi:hypothetical protein
MLGATGAGGGLAATRAKASNGNAISGLTSIFLPE